MINCIKSRHPCNSFRFSEPTVLRCSGLNLVLVCYSHVQFPKYRLKLFTCSKTVQRTCFVNPTSVLTYIHLSSDTLLDFCCKLCTHCQSTISSPSPRGPRKEIYLMKMLLSLTVILYAHLSSDTLSEFWCKVCTHR